MKFWCGYLNPIRNRIVCFCEADQRYIAREQLAEYLKLFPEYIGYHFVEGIITEDEADYFKSA